MMRFLYTFVFYCLLPVVLLRLLWRSVSAPAYARRWAERFAFFPALATSKKVVWLHTVSVGEFIAALPLIRRLQVNASIQLVITTTTPTGSERVRATLGDSVFHVYAPYDLPDVIARFLHRINPSVYLVMETELWPNTLAACAKRNIPALLVNGRLSAKSARGYARFSGLTAPMLQHISTALIQNHTDAQRFIELGLPQSNMVVTGNIKFDLTLSDELKSQAQLLKSSLSNNGQRLIWIAASTHQGEDEIILDAFAQLREHKAQLHEHKAQSGENTLLVPPLLILVPRHPERFSRVGQLCDGLGFKTIRRSSGVLATDMDILLGDTMGELLLLFGASDIAFVGGSLVPNGGHNFIEPAAWGLPLLSGEHLFNFAEVSQLMMQADALQMTGNANELTQAVQVLMQDAALRNNRGKNALRVAQENRGALDKTLAVIERYLQ